MAGRSRSACSRNFTRFDPGSTGVTVSCPSSAGTKRVAEGEVVQPAVNNRRAKYYELTPTGRKHLAAETIEWRKLTDAVDLILGIA